MLKNSKALSLLAHTLIGLGLSSIHIYHISSVFENDRDFSHLSQIEREMTFRGEEALYYSFYKTVLETDNDSGIVNLIKDNLTEYPRVINSMKKFHIYPEVIIGYLYKQFLSLSAFLNFPTVVCWTVEREKSTQDQVISCEGFGEPIYFYLSVVWCLSGFTIFLLYMYGYFLCRNLLGGLATVAYYFTIHQDATNIHKNPMLRENFAFPFILSQIFYVNLYIARCNFDRQLITINNANIHNRDYSMIFSLIFFTTAANLMWNISTYVFLTQVFTIFILLLSGNVTSGLVLDYSISQIVSNLLAYYYMFGNNYFLNSAHMSASIGLLIYLARVKMYRTPEEEDEELQHSSKFKRIMYHVFFFVIVSYFVQDLFDRFVATTGSNASILNSGSINNKVKSPDDITSHYVDYFLVKMGLKTPSFITLLYFFDTHSEVIDLETVKNYGYVFVFKHLAVFIIIHLGKILQKRRKQIVEEKNEMIERAKNYVIEDYLEENRINMQNMTDPNTEKQIKICLLLLEKCNYDYDLYKMEKKSHRTDKINEKISFLNDIKKLKTQISEKEKNKDKRQKTKELDEEKEPLQTETVVSEEEESPTEPEKPDKPENSEKAEAQEEGEYFIQPYYFYGIIQTVLLGLLSLKFLLTPFLCLLSSTLPARNWFAKNSGVYWVVYLLIVLCTLNYPGIKNIREQYKSTHQDNPELEDLLKWIDGNTDENAVFGSTIDLAPQILLITRRPIVNHPLIEFADMAERTKSIYSVFSKKSSNEIYNNLVKLRVQYVVIPYNSCYLPSKTGIKLYDIWDFIEQENYSNIPFCISLFQKANPTFLKIYENYKYLVLKIFSQSVQIEMKKINFLEYHM